MVWDITGTILDYPSLENDRMCKDSLNGKKGYTAPKISANNPLHLK